MDILISFLKTIGTQPSSLVFSCELAIWKQQGGVPYVAGFFVNNNLAAREARFNDRSALQSVERGQIITDQTSGLRSTSGCEDNAGRHDVTCGVLTRNCAAM